MDTPPPNASPASRGRLIDAAALAAVALLLAAVLWWPRPPAPTPAEKEQRLVTGLAQLRAGIQQFQQDTGVWPAQLSDLTVAEPLTPTGKGVHGASRGPYLAVPDGVGGGLPRNPYAAPGDEILAHHWIYNARKGTVRSAEEGIATDGRAYSAL